MVSHSDLARQFAEGASKGKGSNMFIEEDAIYSYGHHFPVAVRLAHGNFLVNSDSYSRSTSKHQSYVRRFIPANRQINAPTEVLKSAIRQGADSVVEIERTVIPSTFAEMEEVLIDFLQSQGFGRRAHTRSKKFIKQMRQLALLENV